MGMVKIGHPEIEAVGETTDEAFHRVWEPRGWHLVAEEVVEANEVLGENITDLEQLTKAQLVEYGRNVGVEGLTMSMSKPDLIEALTPEEAES